MRDSLIPTLGNGELLVSWFLGTLGDAVVSDAAAARPVIREVEMRMVLI